MEFQHSSRVIILVDMDCFYCQVEEKLNPLLTGKPIAVVQYNAWRGGGIIAVNYPARDKGVTRHMRGNEAKEICPDIELVKVPTTREKADLTKYRDAGKHVAAVLQTYTDLLERASVDEAYMDVTDAVENRIAVNHPITLDQLRNTHIVGYDIKDFIDNFRYEHHLESNFRLGMGGIIAEEIRAAVFEKTGYKCSAGIAHNKTLAKLACGLHKPNQQTILPQDGVEGLFATLPLRKIKSLGGKFGCNLGEDLGIKAVGELKRFSEKDLINRYDEKMGSWLYNIARGTDLEPVTVRLVSKSIGCCKKFPGRSALIHPEDVQHWINELSIEISERLNKDLEENNRKAKHMVVSFLHEIDRKDISASRTHPLTSYEPQRIAADMLKVLNKHCLNAEGFYHIKYLGVSAGKFEECKKHYDISSYFKTCDKETNTECTKPEYNLSYFFSNQGKTVNSNTDSHDTNSINFNIAKSHDTHDDLKQNRYENKSLMYNNNSNETITNRNDLNSIFLEDTIPLDEADMILKGEYKGTELVPTNSITIKNEDCETDSITDEIVTMYDDNIDVGKNTSSYFSNYFNDTEFLNRNFDTSRNLKGESSLDPETSSTENWDTNSESTNDNLELENRKATNILDEREDIDENISNNTISIIPTISSDNVKPINPTIDNAFSNLQNYLRPFEDDGNDDTKERCKECRKLILKSDMTSHMDYHFALQMVRDEAHLYNSQNNTTPPIPLKKPVEVKQAKRKKCDATSGKLTTFFKSTMQLPTDTDTLTEMCPHCTKKIAIDDFSNHLDYHVARRLDSEINPVIKKQHTEINSVVIHNRKKPAKSKNNRQTSKQCKSKSVMSFFNQNM